MMTVLDVQGVKMSDITTDVIRFIQQSSEIMDNYYPNRYVRTVRMYLLVELLFHKAI